MLFRRLHLSSYVLRRQFSTSSVTCEKVFFPNKEQVMQKFAFKHFTHTVRDIQSSIPTFLNQKVTLNGWVDGNPRKISSKLVFAAFRDFNGDFTQLTAKGSDISTTLRSLKPEDVLSVSGTVKIKKQKRGFDAENIQEWELVVDDVEILNKSNEKATQLDSLKQTPSLYPPEYRYLQLRLPLYQRALKMRSKAAHIARSVFESLDFVEIETPLLFKSTPEGAKEFLVPTRRKGLFYALPQSPQQYKQMLMASGFKGYYQIAKCFRDEDLRSDRQPEFTQIDMEMSFAKSKDVQNVVQRLLKTIWKVIRGIPLYKIDPSNNASLLEIDVNDDFPKMNYMEALTKYGIDKPDLRSSLFIQDISQYFSGKPLKRSDFGVTEACVLKGALDLHQSSKSLSVIESYSTRTPYIFRIRNQNELNTWARRLPNGSDVFIADLNKKLGLEIGDIVAVSDRQEFPYESPTPLGRFRQIAISTFPNSWRRRVIGNPQVASDDIFATSWLVNFPLFSPSEGDAIEGYPEYDFHNLESTHHPFTMVKLDDYDLLNKEPLKAKGDHYDLVVNGVEVGGGSRRVHDAELQKFIFSSILKIDNYSELFDHLLRALSSGCPPHAGLAIGFDRMCSMLLGSKTIRDVVAFPKTQAGTDPVVQSPSNIPEKALALYGISVRK